jgi:hypothetical protein
MRIHYISLIFVGMILAACAPKAPQNNAEKEDFYAKCSAIYSRMAADLGRIDGQMAEQGIPNLRQAESENAQKKFTDYSLVYLEVAASYSDTVAAAKKMADYAAQYGVMFRNDVTKTGSDKHYRAQLFADADKCKPS